MILTCGLGTSTWDGGTLGKSGGDVAGLDGNGGLLGEAGGNCAVGPLVLTLKLILVSVWAT